MRIRADIAAEIREATRATPVGVARVRARVYRTAIEPAAEGARALRALPPMSAAAEDRVRRRVLRTLDDRARRRPMRVWLGAGALAGAAAVAWMVAFRPVPDDAARALDLPLRSTGDWSEALPAPHVAVGFDGVGEVGGTAAAPVIVWRSGVIEVHVDPGTGVDLTVRTREGEVRVVGTRFRVTRDVLGTAVEVDRGRVQVTCAGEAPVFLGPEGDRRCLPTSAAGLLGRARALVASGDPEGGMAAAEAGLAVAVDGDATWGELLAVQTQIHDEAGRPDRALELAARYLDAGALVRRVEMLRIAARSGHAAGGCAMALPYLAALDAAGELGPGERAALERCSEP